MLKSIVFIFIVLLGLTDVASAQDASQSFSLDGRLYRDAQSSAPMLESSIQFVIQIVNPSQDCILYEEIQQVSTLNTNGFFSLRVGSAPSSLKRGNNDSAHAMSQIYSNTMASLSGKDVTNGSACTYNPTAGESRYLRVQVTPNSDQVTRLLEPLMALDSVPAALVAERAETLQGFYPENFLFVNSLAGSQLTQSNLENVFSSTNYPKLTTLLQSNGVVTSIVAGEGLTGGTITGAGQTISIDVGTAANQIVQLDAGAKLPDVDGSALRNLDGGAITSGTVGYSVLPATVLRDGGNSTSGPVQVGSSMGSAQDLQLVTNGVSRLNVASSGFVGIGTASPVTNLDVNGSVRVGADASPCTLDLMGAIHLNGAELQYCDGTMWSTLVTGGSGAYLPSTGGTLTGALNISSGGLSVVGGINSNSGSITGVGSNLTGSSALTVAAGGSNQNLKLSSSGTGSVNLGSGNGTSLSVLDGGASTVNYVTVRGAATGQAPTIGSAGANADIDLKFAPKGAGNSIFSSGKVGIGSSSPNAPLDVKGAIVMSGSASGYAGFQPAAAAGSTVWTLPAADGTSNQVLTTNGSGGLSWTTPSAGVGSISATAPIASSGGATPTISIAQATTSTSGYLSSADWNTFSGKAPTASPTFTGVPAAPTAAQNTNTTQLATTAFVLGQAASTNPVMDGVAAVGTGTTFARVDHVHPTDTSRAPAAGSSSITTLGTVTSGTWNGTTVGVGYGGTGSTDGSITGTGALTFAAGGSNKNVTLTPSGTGATVLNGKVGIGTTSPLNQLNVYSSTGADVVRLDGDSGYSEYQGRSYSDTDWQGSYFTGWRARGTFAAPTAVVSGDLLSTVGAYGYDGSAYINAGQLRFDVSGTPSSGVVPSAFKIFTTDSAGTFAERFRISRLGLVGIGTTTPASALDVNGSVRVGADATACSSTIQGAIHLNGTVLEYCNGTSWSALTSGGAGTYLASSGGTLSGALTISSGGLNNSSGGITNAGSITGVGTNLTGSGAMTVAAGGTAQNLTLNSSTTGSVNVGSGNGTSLSVLDGGASTVNYVTIKGAAAGGTPVIGTAGSSANIDLTLTPKGSGNIVVSSGKVGIGTTTPNIKLEVRNSNEAFRLDAGLGNSTWQSFGENGTTYGTIGYDKTGSTRLAAGVANSLFVRAENNLHLLTSSSGDVANGITITSSGNVGIGTTTPDQKFVVADGNAPLKLKMQPNAGVLGYGIEAESTLGNWARELSFSYAGSKKGSMGAYSNDGTLNYLYFNASQGGASTGYATPSMVILPSGSVGIGTTSPTGLLNIQSSGNSYLYNDSFSNGGGSPVFILRKAKGSTSSPSAVQSGDRLGALHMMGYGATGFTGSNSTLAIEGYAEENFTDSAMGAYLAFGTTNTGSNVRTEKMRITANGKVGIGTMNPSYSLDVSGSVNASSLYIGGTAVALPAYARAATNANITLSGTQTIDGVSVVAGDRVLVKNQTTVADNGVYIVSSSAWSRATDLDTWAEGVGYLVTVTEGTKYAGMKFVSVNSVSGTLGSSAFNWAADGSTSTSTSVAVGQFAMNALTSGYNNVAIGNKALYQVTTATDNVAVGPNALYSNTTGNSNTGVGSFALQGNTTGLNNSALGAQALSSNTTGDSNVAAGNFAMYSTTTGKRNTSSGIYSLYSNVGMYESTAFGYYSMYNANSSTSNTASYNTAIGAYSLYGSNTPANNTGIKNTALGHSALYSLTSGGSNIGIGYNAGSSITTGSNNVVIGSNTGSTIATASNVILVADGAGNERLRVDSSGNLGVGTSSPGATLDVAGHIANSGASATVGTCGTSPSITGNDTRGVFTLGTGSPTACTVTFASAFGSAPYCTVTAYGGNPGSIQWWISTTTTSLVVNFSATPTASQKFHYHCIQ